MAYVSPLPRKVFILGDGMLFEDIIAHMLTSLTNLRVIKRVYAGKSAFVTDVNGCHPDIILLNETGGFNSEQILALLSQMTLAADLRVIVMSLNHKNIIIYDQPAGRMDTQTSVPYTLNVVDDWNELLDLVGGKQLPQ